MRVGFAFRDGEANAAAFVLCVGLSAFRWIGWIERYDKT
jgi:hypothetical protein